MPNKKITELDAITSLALTDLITVVVDPSGSPINKKMTIGNFLLTLGLKTGEGPTVDTLTTAGKVITFASAHGTPKTDQVLMITCRTAANDGDVAYEITAWDANGFTIVPADDCTLIWSVIDL